MTGLLLAASALPVTAQCPPITNPTNSAWVNLPAVDEFDPPTRRNAIAKDLEILEVLVDGGTKLRAFYTTEGSLDTAPNPDQLYPGYLRLVDIDFPVPDLAAASPVFTIKPPVSSWNLTSAGSEWGDLPGTYGKGGSIVGMLSVNSSLFVHGSHRNIDTLNESAPGDDIPVNQQWNGLSFLPDVSGRSPSMTIQEGWSAGPALGTGTQGTTPFAAVPEGSDVAFSWDDNRWYVAANYCGTDWAGHLLVQWFPNQASVDFNDRKVLPLWEFLGDWNDGLPPWDGLKQAPIDGPLGAEVDREFYTCPSTPTGPDCADGNDNVSGNKLRPVLYVKMRDTAPVNASKRFIVAGLNLDPMDLDSYPSAPNYVPLDNAGRDDGKYDYLAFIDITLMVPDFMGSFPVGGWLYTDLEAWKQHTTFVRLPPDVPAGWSWQVPALPPDSGYDWSTVRIHDPDPEGGSSREVRIAGSGTPKSLVEHPNGQFLYLVASDQNQENVQENATLTDGGWHVPHLYVIDLHAVDLTDQVTINANLLNGTIVKQVHRFNKLISDTFGENGERTGSTLVNSTMGMPTSHPLVDTGLTLVGGAGCADVGPYYPGEFQSDPTARTRMLTLRNASFTNHQDRLYVGTTMRIQSIDPEIVGTTTGAVHVFSLASDGTPSYLQTLTVEQGGSSQKYQISGLDKVPVNWLATGAARNVIAATALNTAFSVDSIDRLAFLQDSYDPVIP